ncbi:MAG TPA: alpha/beta hydrolase [Deltaproteobacteria bacterium]|nr:alpha/beta hydrolase [Deltaproteobacteria bacterium]HPJ94300.1 alpha/beta hydrolase [Deltaproteobacteria bacterium]HPR51391.1 alpha/beta hydrolase [Deltaproteobacteria bacterium]
MIKQYHIGGLHTRVCEARNPSGTIVYIHGLGESGLCFERLIADDRLQRWTHIVPDLPGYGKSPWPDNPVTPEDLSDLLAQWLNEQGIRNSIIIGHSMGGVIGMIVCERHPKCAGAFINIEGNVSYDDCTISRTITATGPEEFISHGKENLLNKIYQGGFRDRTLRTYYASLMMCDPRTLYFNSKELVEISKSEEIPRRLGRLEVPTVYLLGSPRGTGAYSRSLLDAAGVKWMAIEDCGHWPFIEQQDTFIDIMLGYLNNDF